MSDSWFASLPACARCGHTALAHEFAGRELDSCDECGCPRYTIVHPDSVQSRRLVPPPVSRGGWRDRLNQSASPARVCLVSLAPEEALAVADGVLRSRHARFRRTGATGARVYILGSILGEIVLTPASWLLGPWSWLAVHVPVVVHAVPDPTSGGARTRLTLSMPTVHRAAASHVTPMIDAVVGACAARGVLLDAGTPLSSVDLPDGPAQLARFRRSRGD